MIKKEFSSIPSVQAYGGILIRSEGRILLREPANHFDGYLWTFPKGKPDQGEQPEETALREVREETGYLAEVIDLLPGIYNSGLSSNVYFILRPIGDQGTYEWETQSTRWVDFLEAEVLIKETKNEKGRNRDLAVLAASKQWFELNAVSI